MTSKKQPPNPKSARMRRRIRAQQRGEVDAQGKTIPLEERHPKQLQARAERLGFKSHSAWKAHQQLEALKR